MSQGLDNLKRIAVLMMENRSFDDMLGGLKKKFLKINGLNGDESNPDTDGSTVPVAPDAIYRGQLAHDPDHRFPGVDLQIYGGEARPRTRGEHEGICEKLPFASDHAYGGLDSGFGFKLCDWKTVIGNRVHSGS